MSSVRDISERKRAQEILTRYAEELARSSAELARSNADLESFAYVASHDLQEPLRMVSSYVKLLGEHYRGKLDAEADEYIAYSVDGAERMSALIRDLLSYSRVSRAPARQELVDCGTVVGRALTNVQQAVKESHAEITVDSLPVVKGDGSQLERLFQNLIGNAIKYRGDHPPNIQVSARQNGDWTFCIRDNGIGIDPQQPGASFRYVSAAAHEPGICRDGNRPGRVQTCRGRARWQDLGGVRTWSRIVLLLYSAGSRR
jgi:light-regulated signal transduction histidine kinase (bacteriophytochrome)